MKFDRDHPLGAAHAAMACIALCVIALQIRADNAAGVTTAAVAKGNEVASQVDFTRDIQPILSENCYFCHGPDAKRRKAHLRMDVLDPKDGLFAMREEGAAIVPGHVEKSQAMDRILSDDDDEKMPPPDSNRKLTPQQIDLLKRWIEQGAKWSKHWSLVPPRRPELPLVKDAGWVKNPIDRFILARLEQENLRPSPPAGKEALIRRVTLDLTGLPPTPREVDDFLADASPEAYERAVDRLLGSPRYGERMVWEWLDAARYADTNGYQGDATRTMWPWRDWAIRAMNDNMPFDQFTVKQLAGDLLPAATADDKLATAFCRNHMINGEGGRIAEENRVEYVMDQSETVSSTWLGLTVGCARCHDHKFDSISQKDYYSLFAFFNNTPVNGGGGSGQTKPLLDFATPQQEAELARLKEEAKKVSGEVAAIELETLPRDNGQTAADSPKATGLSGGTLAELKKKSPEARSADGLDELAKHFKEAEPKYAEAVAKLRKAIAARDQFASSIPRVMVMQELDKPRETFVLVKGAYDKPADKVTADVPAALPPLPKDAPKNRLALARWLVSPEHPLTARVTVNHFWQQFFGVGLVKTAEDFGVQGEPPSHPQLVDWLAREFIDGSEASGPWNVKAMHRLIVTSAAYRQSSKTTPALTERDPQNRLLARGPRFRMPVWMLRDQALAASGLLTERVGGPPVKPYQPPGIWEEATFGKISYQQDHGPALYRRSVYTFWRRIVAPTNFFDTASRQTCTVKGTRTNTPLHALTTLNDTTFVEAARVLAQRVMTEAADSTPEARVDLACRLVLARVPTPRERTILLAGLDRLAKQYTANAPAAMKLLSVGEAKRDQKLSPAEHAAYTGLCLTILNLDEALTKE